MSCGGGGGERSSSASSQYSDILPATPTNDIIPAMPTDELRPVTPTGDVIPATPTNDIMQQQDEAAAWMVPPSAVTSTPHYNGRVPLLQFDDGNDTRRQQGSATNEASRRQNKASLILHRGERWNRKELNEWKTKKRKLESNDNDLKSKVCL